MVSIIILVQDRYDLVKRCLDSIIEHTTQTDYELVLILQAVKDDRIFNLINSLPCKKTVIYNEVNNGVTPGRNQGIQLSQGEFLLFLDDDAWVSEELENIPEYLRKYDWLGRMLYFYKDLLVGIVGQSGSYINPQQPGIFWACTEVGAECDVVQGYCFMFSRPVVEAIGLLDPYFGKFWHEESEYSLRAKYHGFKVINTKYIGVTHYGSGSGDDGTYGKKIKYMFDKWAKHFDKILVPRDQWKV